MRQARQPGICNRVEPWQVEGHLLLAYNGQMTKEENKTTEAPAEVHDDRKAVPHSYYYDDSTGYEIYNPETAPEDEEIDQ